MEWKFSPNESTNCTQIVRKEDIKTILGRDLSGESSVAKRKIISDLSITNCTIARKETPQVEITHGDLEGTELLAHKTAEGLWVYDELPGTTEKQKYQMMMEGFTEPFSEFPKERIPIGKVILLKDQDISFLWGSAFPGKTNGTLAMKFDRVIMEREPFAQLSISYDIAMTTLAENNEEVVLTLTVNGGCRISISDNTKLNSSANLTGIIKAGMPNSQDALSGPASLKIIIKEL
jgi:hypothetical protein